MLTGSLWAIVVVLVVLWLIGFLALHIGSGLSHILLVIAVIVLLYNLFFGRRASEECQI
jgi:hypothetical protein